MRRFVVAVAAAVILIPVFSLAEEQMDKHMKEHMGGMQTKTESNKNANGLTQEAEAAGVTVKVTYQNPDGKAPAFNIVLDTHSADLDGYRFNEIALLRVESGKVYKPAVISESGSGHHREAMVEFKGAELTISKPLELVIRGVAGVDERVFKFKAGKE